MLFYAPSFLFGILPATLALFHLAARFRPRLCGPVLLAASLGFYASQDLAYLPLLAGLFAANAVLVRQIRHRSA